MLVIIFTVFLFVSCESAKILALLPCASPSHGIWNRALVEELASRGHKITAVTPDPGKNTENLHYVNIREDTYPPVLALNASFINMAHYSWKQNVDAIFGLLYFVCDNQIKSKTFQDLLNLNEKYDLVIHEALGNDCFLGLLPKLGVPIVGISAFGCTPWGCESMGVHLPMAVYPDYNLSYTTSMTFWQRIMNAIVTWYTEIIRVFIYMPAQEKLSKSVFGEDIPSLSEIERNYSVLLVNEGPAGVDPSKAYPPSVIPVGCLQCRPGKPLTKDLQVFLDGADQGAIYFSLGTNAKCGEMVPEKLSILREVFSSLPQRVLWKCEVDTLPDLPANVKLSKWVPQQDVLAHPKVLVFITHGGRLSTQEANYHGVPILSMPLFSDQFLNARRSEEQGLGLQLNFDQISKEKFQNYVHALLQDQKYKNKAKEVSGIIHDQPETAMDRAVFWTEYVIRHNGAPHLRSPITQISWYQLYYLDVGLVGLIQIGLTVLVIKILWRKMCTRENISNSKKKNK